ncbi:hypothetical protein LTR53_001441 [Teratosphaeriaceae sp. CCFEE 6253]|nr:hypothetical protein LTR53_001441 [Teratosphaeriaceae sp. CCFEE 6253]
MGFQMILTAIAVLLTFVFAAPVAQGGPPGISHITPYSGGTPGHYWHVQDATITFPSHQIHFEANYTEDQPRWNPSWAPNRGHNFETADLVETVEKIDAIGSGIHGHVINKCHHTIYVQTAIGYTENVTNGASDPPGTDTYPIPRGTTYTTTILPVINGDGGVSIKLGNTAVLNPDNSYEIEYAQHTNPNCNMAIWYDVSAIKGNPFWNTKRYTQVTTNPGSCKTIYNPPGSNAADYPANQNECEVIGDIFSYLC